MIYKIRPYLPLKMMVRSRLIKRCFIGLFVVVFVTYVYVIPINNQLGKNHNKHFGRNLGNSSFTNLVKSTYKQQKSCDGPTLGPKKPTFIELQFKTILNVPVLKSSICMPPFLPDTVDSAREILEQTQHSLVGQRPSAIQQIVDDHSVNSQRKIFTLWHPIERFTHMYNHFCYKYNIPNCEAKDRTRTFLHDLYNSLLGKSSMYSLDLGEEPNVSLFLPQAWYCNTTQFSGDQSTVFRLENGLDSFIQHLHVHLTKMGFHSFAEDFTAILSKRPIEINWISAENVRKQVATDPESRKCFQKIYNSDLELYFN